MALREPDRPISTLQRPKGKLKYSKLRVIKRDKSFKLRPKERLLR